MEKFIVHRIRITQKQEKKIFQIILPDNTHAITGIAAGCDAYLIPVEGEEDIQRPVGTLTLFVPDTGEQIYSDNLHACFAPATWQKFDEVSFDRKLWLTKVPFKMLETHQQASCTFIEGFYQDEVGDVLSTVNYTVRIYLRLKQD